MYICWYIFSVLFLWYGFIDINFVLFFIYILYMIVIVCDMELLMLLYMYVYVLFIKCKEGNKIMLIEVNCIGYGFV